MNKLRHTPGPWYFLSNRVNLNLYFFTDSEGQLLGEALGTNRDTAENEANARLISSAPEMLETLLQIHSYYSDFEKFALVPVGELRKLIEKIITKAKDKL